MSSRFYFALTFLLVPIFSFGQISGNLLNKSTGKALSGATITLLMDNKKTGPVTYSAANGTFSFPRQIHGKYHLSISYVGYKTFCASVQISVEQEKLDMGTIVLDKAPINLSGVEIKAKTPIVSIRKDTVEYSAKDFKTAENATLQNLLQKIPGLSIDEQGNIFFQGTQIKDFLLDGRPVLQSALPGMGSEKFTQKQLAILAEKIQIIDKKVPGAMNPGSDQGKVLNITVRKEMKTGVNGSIGGGYGTKDRYSIAGNANLLRDNRQIMLSGGSYGAGAMRPPSNTDESDLLMDPIGGILKMTNISANASFDLNKKVRLTAFLLHQFGNLANENRTQRDNVLADSSFRYNASNTRNSHMYGDNFMASLDLQASERDRFNINLNGMLMNNDNVAQSRYLSLSGNGDTTNYGHTSNLETQKLRTFNLGGNYNHKFKTIGREFTLNWNLELDNNHSQQQNQTNSFFKAGGTSDTINQKIKSNFDTYTLNLSPSFSRILAKGFFWTTSYNFTMTVTKNDQDAFNYDDGLHGYFREDSSLTYRFKNVNLVHVFSEGVYFTKGRIEASVNLSYTINNSTSSLTPDTTFSQNLAYFSPNLNIRYKFNDFKSLCLRFSNSAGMFDRGRSLIPVVSTKNPLYVQLGNPDLKTSVDHQLAIEFRWMDLKGFSFNVTVNGVSQSNGVSSNTYSDSLGRQVTQPVNTSGNYNVYSIMNLGKRFGSLGLTLNYNGFSLLRHNTNFLNNMENTTTSYSSDQRLSLSWLFKKVAEFTLTANMKYTGSLYSLQKDNYTDFLVYKTYFSLNTFLPGNFSIGSTVIYTQNTSLKQDYTLLNGWVSKTFLKAKSLQLKVYAYDLLGQNKSLQSFQTPTFTEQSQNSVLDQYFLCSLSYFFGKR